MQIAHDYLAKYRTLTPPQATKAKIVAKVIADECGIHIPHTEITIRRGGVSVECHPTVRSELARHTAHLMEVLQKEHNVRISFIR
jgi:hypothetical protein